MATALTIDLKRSRSYSEQSRSKLQMLLIRTAEQMNLIFRPALYRELSFSGGDELQGLFSGPGAAFLCLRLLCRAVYPLRLHGGIGQGEWTTVVPERNTFFQDGSAYHRARAAIDRAKRETDWMALLNSGGEGDALRNSMMNGSLQLMARNTAHQNELALWLEYLYPIRPREGLDPEGLAGLPELMRLWREAELCPPRPNRKQEPGSGLRAVEPSPPAAPGSTQWQAQGELFYGYAHPYGAASEVAEALGLTRQAVDAALKASNVYTERALALALTELLD